MIALVPDHFESQPRLELCDSFLELLSFDSALLLPVVSHLHACMPPPALLAASLVRPRLELDAKYSRVSLALHVLSNGD